MRKTCFYRNISKTTFLIFFLFSCRNGISQLSPDSTTIDITKAIPYLAIRNKTEVAFLSADSSLESNYPTINFKNGSSFVKDVPARLVNQKLILRFTVENPTDDPDSDWFFPGLYYASIQLYKVSNGALVKLPNIEPEFADSMGYRLLTLQAHDSATLLAEMTFVKTYINTIRPRLIQKSHLSTFIFDVASSRFYGNIVTYLFCGLFLMMILFSIANYMLGGNREFLYYAGYAFFLGGMLFTKTYYDLKISNNVFFMEAYFDFIMQCTGIGFYMIFMQKFLSTRSKYPFLHTLYNTGIGGVVVSMLLFSYSYFFTNNFVFLNRVENITKIVLLVMMVVFLVYCLKY